jgi:hypothetical protein
MAWKNLAAALLFLATVIIFLVTTDVLRAADTVTRATVSSSTVKENNHGRRQHSENSFTSF